MALVAPLLRLDESQRQIYVMLGDGNYKKEVFGRLPWQQHTRELGNLNVFVDRNNIKMMIFVSNKCACLTSLPSGKVLDGM